MIRTRAPEWQPCRHAVVGSEYGYHRRDQNADGVPDNDNSTSLKSIRHSTWDIVMARTP